MHLLETCRRAVIDIVIDIVIVDDIVVIIIQNFCEKSTDFPAFIGLIKKEAGNNRPPNSFPYYSELTTGSIVSILRG